MDRAVPGKERKDAAAEPTVAPAVVPPHPDGRLAMASAMGNRAFTAYASAAAVAREPAATDTAPPGTSSTATAATTSSAPGATWVAPADYGTCTTHQQARLALIRMRDDAAELFHADFAEFEPLIVEAGDRIQGMAGDGPLSAYEAGQLTWFGSDFRDKHDAAVRTVAMAIARQLTQWISPMSEQDLFELREVVHDAFVGAKDSDLLEDATAALTKAEDLLGHVTSITKWTNKLADQVKLAKTLKELTEPISEFKGKLGEIKEYLELAHNVGTMLGKLGGSPGGMDDVAAVAAGLDVVNFVIDKAGVPGLKILWSDYVYPLAKACLKQLALVKDRLYHKDRDDGFVRMFFIQHQHDAVAPRIDFGSASSLAGAHIDFAEKQFPGGQPVFDFMWQLMRGEPPESVPAAVEKYFLEFRKQMNAGADEADQIESDSHWYNAWNLFTTEHSGNLLPWLQAHKEQAWAKLYGGMPAPSGG